MTWGFIGCGNLAQALIKGALSKKIIKPSEIFAIDHDPVKLKKFSNESGISPAKSLKDLVKNCSVIVLATKPQDILEPLKELEMLTNEKHSIVSLAAGVSGSLLEKFLIKPDVIARVMANTAATIQKGTFGILFVRDSSEESVSTITDFFKALGEVILVSSDQDIDSVTAGSASGIGFVFSFMEEFEKWFLKRGFNKEEARLLTVETFLGASEYAKSRMDIKIEQLREQVTSRRGTTLAGLTAMKKAKVSSGLRSGLDAAFARSREIAKSLLKTTK